MPETQHVVTPEQREALDVAERMIAAGIPVFAAPPCPAAHGGSCSRPGHEGGRQEYDLPPKWQLTVPSAVWLERWQPGHALAAVGGHAADFLDVDPRNGGDTSEATLMRLGHLPRVYGAAETPSGGRHYLIAPLGERKACPVAPDLPGLDYQGGAPDGQGRGFVFIAPTVRRSKVDGKPGTYRWAQPPDLQWLAEGGDSTGELLATRIISGRTRTESQHDNRSETREFTETEAQAFCNITLQRLMRAQIGEIEEAANAAAAQLSHFVPDFWNEDFAYSVLTTALGETAYDPEHPASGWTADKFRPVLAGTGSRAPGDWKAVRKPEPVLHIEDVPAPEPDAVEALLAEMLKPSEVITRPRPRYLIQGVLNLDSESWLIGAPGSKKSFVALDMAGRVANGQRWQGLKTRPCGVVIIAAEGAGGLGNRLAAWEKINGPMGDRVDILPRPVQSAELSKWAVLVEACRRLAPGLVVIDTQARVTVGLEENSAKEMGIYVEAMRAIREATGACVLSVHHTGRRGGDARGSSAIDGAQFTELKTEVDAGDRLRGVLKIEKQKDMEMGPDIPLLFERVELGLDEDGELQTSLVLSADPYAVASGQGKELQLADDWALHWEGVQQQILTALVDQGGEIGLTKAEARTNVVQRWYPGGTWRVSAANRGHQKPVGSLSVTTFDTAWTKVLEARSASGDPIVSNPSGQKFVVDPVARAAWQNAHEGTLS